MKRSLAIAFCLLVSLVVGGAFAQSPQSPQPPDILGIQIGMSADKALQILNAHAAELRAQNVTLLIQPLAIAFDVLPKRMGWGVNAHTAPPTPGGANPPSENITVVFTMPPNPQVVAEVHRQLQYSRGNMPAKSTLLASLHDKYGTESFREKDPQDLRHNWMFKDGRQQFFNSENSADRGYVLNCDFVIGSPTYSVVEGDRGIRDLLNRGFPANISVDAKGKCAGVSHVYAMTNFDSTNRDLVFSFMVSLANIAMEDAALDKTRTMLQNLAEAKRQEEINRAKASKPQL